MKLIGGLLALILLAAACSSGGGSVEAVDSVPTTTASSIVTTSVTTEVTGEEQNGSPADSSVSMVSGAEAVADVQPWPIGPMFTASEFQLNGEVLQQPVWLGSSLSGSFDVSLDACEYGGHGDFEIIGDRLIVTNLGPSVFPLCPEEPAATVEKAEVLHALFLSEPRIEVTADSIVLENQTTRLVLKTDDPTANQPVAPTGIWFRGVSATDTTINPERVSMIVRAFFVIDFQLETCLLHAQAGELEQVSPRDVVSYINLDDCPEPSESDRAVLKLLGTQPTLLYTDGRLTITGTDGTTITME